MLLQLAYRMLGSRAEAEDVVQEAWLRWSAAGTVEQPTAWLRTVVTRLCLDELRSARVRRRAHVGPWLPEPLHERDPALGPPEALLLRESASLALLLLLERLSPAERAVYVLREAFELPYVEVATAVGRSPAACRQLRARGTAKLAGRPEPISGGHQALIEALLGALAQGDVAAVAALLDADCTLISDGAGRARSARRPVLGGDRVARFLDGLARQMPAGTSLEVRSVNGAPAAVLLTAGVATVVMSCEIRNGVVLAVSIVVDPEKLGHVTPAVAAPS